jgi:glutaredoxin 3
MARIEIYTKFLCPYCVRAKKILESKAVRYEEYEISLDIGKRTEMMERANGRHTVPQIFINDRHVGGSDDLTLLEQSGELDRLLAA